MGASQSGSEKSIHEFRVKDYKAKDVDLSVYKGKVLLVVNVASKCGLTDSNYTQLTELYNKYKDRGFEILAFPCNQFLKQEPGSSEQAQEFACTRYKAEYPIFHKVRVNGPDAAPVYKFLKAHKSGFLGSRIKWNFTKFLVDKEGTVLARYGPTTAPLTIEVLSSLYTYSCECVVVVVGCWPLIFIVISKYLLLFFFFLKMQADIQKALGDK
ncbi:probable glutathione peroxidase 5 isoform X1 [Vitis vinifera]|uniref:probable glutathione peroxidase 5 isoform X1 n=1 Tax=Vitis vinifera TaxID=29760 RepID=UPI002882FDB8|nr:probable glutathione peroxidase 5 isoform X1 [Vitis vinifera]